MTFEHFSEIIRGHLSRRGLLVFVIVIILIAFAQLRELGRRTSHCEDSPILPPKSQAAFLLLFRTRPTFEYAAARLLRVGSLLVFIIRAFTHLPHAVTAVAAVIFFALALRFRFAFGLNPSSFFFSISHSSSSSLHSFEFLIFLRFSTSSRQQSRRIKLPPNRLSHLPVRRVLRMSYRADVLTTIRWVRIRTT